MVTKTWWIPQRDTSIITRAVVLVGCGIVGTRLWEDKPLNLFDKVVITMAIFGFLTMFNFGALLIEDLEL
tara:strand:+ start:195 stop:404 length:210 start_codon:yes stop_codon:yes gene_type:complete